MAEFEEKLNAILGDPSAMGQIMSLARSLSGEGEPQTRPEPAGTDEPEEAPMPDLSALLGQLDPGLIRAGLQLLGDSQGAGDRNGALLEALRPFLKADRRARLDRAREILRVARLVRVVMEATGRGVEDV